MFLFRLRTHLRHPRPPGLRVPPARSRRRRPQVGGEVGGEWGNVHPSDLEVVVVAAVDHARGAALKKGFCIFIKQIEGMKAFLFPILTRHVPPLRVGDEDAL